MKNLMVAILGCLSLSAQAASFDCSKAQSKVEKLLCSNPKLSKLDDDLRKYYRKAMEKADEGQKQILVEQQKHWLKHTRNVCRDEPRLKKAYSSILENLAAFAGTEELRVKS